MYQASGIRGRGAGLRVIGSWLMVLVPDRRILTPIFNCNRYTKFQLFEFMTILILDGFDVHSFLCEGAQFPVQENRSPRRHRGRREDEFFHCRCLCSVQNRPRFTGQARR